jgi:hypothetical protein
MAAGSFVVVSFYHGIMPFITLLYVDMNIHVMLTFVSVLVQSVQFIDMTTCSDIHYLSYQINCMS